MLVKTNYFSTRRTEEEVEDEAEAEDGDRGWKIGGEDDAARNGLRINDGKVNCEHRGTF